MAFLDTFENSSFLFNEGKKKKEKGLLTLFPLTREKLYRDGIVADVFVVNATISRINFTQTEISKNYSSL